MTCDQNKRVKMAEFKDGEDINSFLKAFKGIMKLNEVEEDDWLNFLVPSLAGKAREVSQYIDYSDCTYDEVKRRLKQHFDVNADALRQKFREKKWENGSTPKHYVREMEQLLNRWLPEGMDFRELKQTLLIEQILNSLPREMRTFVGERQPKDSGQVIELLQLT